MNNLKKSKKKFNKIALYSYLKKKSYIVVRLNNNNKTTIESVYKKINKVFLNSFISSLKNKVYLNIIVDSNAYYYLKNKIFKALNSENFSYKISHIKIGKNNLSIDFFENQILIKVNKLELIKELVLFSNILFINNNIYIKKNLFIILNLFIINFNLFKINVYNTSSSI